MIYNKVSFFDLIPPSYTCSKKIIAPKSPEEDGTR